MVVGSSLPLDSIVDNLVQVSAIFAVIWYQIYAPKILGIETFVHKRWEHFSSRIESIDHRIRKVETKQKKSSEVLGALARVDTNMDEERVYEDLFENGTDPEYYYTDAGKRKHPTGKEDHSTRRPDNVGARGGIYITDESDNDFSWEHDDEREEEEE